jgi:Domain of unknown function (DUF4381)
MNADWLAQLAPEHAPPAPGWWPMAPGWLAVSVLGALLVAAAIWRWRNPRLRQQRKALRELESIRAYASNEHDIGATARAIQNLMRRYAIALFGRDQVAQLSGSKWLEFLVDHGGTSFKDVGQSLLVVAFGAHKADQHRNHCARWFDGADAFLSHAGKTRTKLRTGRTSR